jgi:hypothetical protein
MPRKNNSKRAFSPGSDRDPEPEKKLKADAQQKKAAKEYAKAVFGRGHDEFYRRAEDLATKARNGYQTAIDEVFKIDLTRQSNRHFQEEIARRVRLPATKAGGALKGAGYDEILKTSKTTELLKLSAGLVHGKQPVSTFVDSSGKTRTLSWLGMQKTVRVTTAVVPTKVASSGHTGAVRRTLTSKGYMTEGQHELHEERQNAVEAGVTPLDAVRRALHAHLRMTPNAEAMKTSHTQGFDVMNKSFSIASEKEGIIERMASARDLLKIRLGLMPRDTLGPSEPLSPRFKQVNWSLNDPFEPVTFKSVIDYAKI